jgi:hypothetical protein
MPVSREDIVIRTLAVNDMKLDEIVVAAKSKDDSTALDKQLLNDNQEALFGDKSPLVVINGYNITRFLSYFDMDMNGFMPVIRFSFTALDPIFISVNYPKDGDIVSVYIRSAVEGVYKPLRMDFNVLSVSSDVTSKVSSSGMDPVGEGKNMLFSILAECRIPGIYTHRSRSFSAKTSYEALLEISQDLSLGFSTNDADLVDKMSWICPNYSYYDYIREVTESSFKDDNSFFHSFIDCYYNLNFVNLGNQFGYTDPLTNNPDKVMVLNGGSQTVKPDSALPGVSNPEPKEQNLIITNQWFGSIYPFSINGYMLISGAGQKANKTGYFTEIAFYDEKAEVNNLEEKVVRYDIESVTPENISDGEILQKGRSTEDLYKGERRIEWLGVMNEYSENNPGVHSNYLHAQFQNEMNIQDCTKMTLRVELDQYFPGIYRGQVIPIEIYVFDTRGKRKENAGSLDNGDQNSSSSGVRDNFLSGNYVIMGMNVTFDPIRGMKQVLNLCKRTWFINTSGKSEKSYPGSNPSIIT